MHRTPWTGKEEDVPIGGESDDCDVPFVIRDADGQTVLTLWEDYGPASEPRHIALGERIVAAVNAVAS